MNTRRFVRILSIAGVVAVLAVGAVSVATAAPASVDTYRSCSPDGDSGLDTICYTIHDVEKLSDPQDSYSEPSREVGFMVIEYFDPEGNLLWSDKTRWHRFAVEKDGESQVYHDQVKVTYQYEGETCTAVMNVTFANGEVRHLGPEWEWVCR